MVSLSLMALLTWPVVEDHTDRPEASSTTWIFFPVVVLRSREHNSATARTSALGAFLRLEKKPANLANTSALTLVAPGARHCCRR